MRQEMPIEAKINQDRWACLQGRDARIESILVLFRVVLPRFYRTRWATLARLCACLGEEHPDRISISSITQKYPKNRPRILNEVIGGALRAGRGHFGTAHLANGSDC